MVGSKGGQQWMGSFFFFSPVSPSHKACMKVEWKTKGSEAIEIVATESPRPVIGHVSVKIIAYKIHTFQFNLCNLCGSIWFGFFGVSVFTFRARKGNAKKTITQRMIVLHAQFACSFWHSAVHQTKELLCMKFLRYTVHIEYKNYPSWYQQWSPIRCSVSIVFFPPHNECFVLRVGGGICFPIKLVLEALLNLFHYKSIYGLFPICYSCFPRVIKYCKYFMPLVLGSKKNIHCFVAHYILPSPR